MFHDWIHYRNTYRSGIFAQLVIIYHLNTRTARNNGLEGNGLHASLSEYVGKVFRPCQCKAFDNTKEVFCPEISFLVHFVLFFSQSDYVHSIHIVLVQHIVIMLNITSWLPQPLLVHVFQSKLSKASKSLNNIHSSNM